MKAIWHDTVIAESNNTVIVDGNHYFPFESVNQAHLRGSTLTSTCGWKGLANYYTIVIGEHVNENAAWVYRTPKEAASNIENHLAFWHGVVVTP